MEHDLVLEGRVVGPSGLLDTEVGVTEGLIAELGHGLRGARRIKAGRSLIFPGFVDIHVHLREPGWERKEDFRTGTLAAVHGGVTTVADMPNNPEPIVSVAGLESKRRLARQKGVVDVKLYGGALAGNLANIGEMADGVVGFKIYLSETTGTRAFPESELGGAFEAIASTGKPVSLHCEKQSVIDARRDQLRGREAPDLHCELRPPEAEVESVEEVLAALRGRRAPRVNVCHASTGEAVRRVKSAAAEGLDVHCEATLHHLYFNRRAMLQSRVLKTNPPLRSEEDRQALLGGIRDGAVSFLATDHAPHLESEKMGDGPSGVPGLDDYAHVVSWLIREQGVDPTIVARVACSSPSNHLQLHDRGKLAVGLRADITVLDVHSPETVRRDSLQSKCGWSPYEGREFPGRARWVIRRGDLMMDDFEIAV